VRILLAEFVYLVAEFIQFCSWLLIVASGFTELVGLWIEEGEWPKEDD